MRLLFRPFLTVIVTQNTVCEENIHPTSSSSSGEVAEKRLTLYAGTRNKRLEGSFSLPQTRPFSRGLAITTQTAVCLLLAQVHGHSLFGHSCGVTKRRDILPWHSVRESLVEILEAMTCVAMGLVRVRRSLSPSVWRRCSTRHSLLFVEKEGRGCDGV